MAKRYVLQVEIGEQMDREIEELTTGLYVSKSEAARDLMRRGLKDLRQEQKVHAEGDGLNVQDGNESAA